MNTEERLDKLERELLVSGRSKGSSPCRLPIKGESGHWKERITKA
jgi:hypothetical protein